VIEDHLCKHKVVKSLDNLKKETLIMLAYLAR